MQIRALALLKGAATFIPGAMRFACGGSGGTDSSRYCYSVWLRHVIRLAAAGLDTNFATVAELGPGDSLGIGLAAVLTGADRYFALDALPHAQTVANLRTLDDLVEFFSHRERVPDTDEFPQIWPPLPSLDFPAAVLGNGRLDSALQPQRISAIRRALQVGDSGRVAIRYAAPWTDSAILQPDSVDLVISQAVLEHVSDMDATYQDLFRWLKPGGVMSHQIDFQSHGLTRDWYGHWTIPAWMWRVVKGRRPYLINRLPASAHLRAMQRAGFEVLQTQPLPATAPDAGELAPEFRYLSDDDLRTAALFVIAQKPRHVVSV